MASDKSVSYEYENVPGNYYDKYNSKNPIVRLLLNGFLSAFDALIAESGASNVLEVGCGEGNLSLRMLRSGLAVRGIDVEETSVHEAAALIESAGLKSEFEARDLYSLDASWASELVVCCEVLEHLPNPEHALDVLAKVASPWLLVSVPREPVWRLLNVARGRYWSDLGNTPGHIQHWSSQEFIRFLESRVDVVRVEKPIPWTMLLCRCD